MAVDQNDLAAAFGATAYRWPFRRYQSLALTAFEQARADGRTRVYLVLPPGAGKTALGLEIGRRLGTRTLALCPNTAVQSQWVGQWNDFEPATVRCGADWDLSTPVLALTYQALCNLNSEDDGLDERALALWERDLQSREGWSAEQSAEQVAGLLASGSPAYNRELAHYRRRVRSLLARGGDRAELLSLLHPNGQDLVRRLKATGPWTIILDECHHLLAMWGYVARALVEELGEDVFVVGLTATPPADMDAAEVALYRDLFGRADFEVPTPAVVKEGDLAPYQELAYFVTPLPHENRYIEDQHRRFEALTRSILDPAFASTSLVEWLRARVGERRGADGTRMSWGRFEQDEPALAEAALRFFFAHRLRLPRGARLQERHRLAPNADDWVVLIEDYASKCLSPSGDERDQHAWREIRATLPSLGYVMTRHGVRSHISPVDRVLALSAAKATAAQEILSAEARVLGPRLRALLLCDYETAGKEALAKLRGVLDPQAGSAALLLHLLVNDPSVAELKPILMTGRTVACSRAAAADLCAWIKTEAPWLDSPLDLATLFAEGDFSGLSWDDVVVVRPRSSAWRARDYVPLLTRYFEEGRSRCLVGTRGLLGEGWDARSVNVLLDLTAASTSTSVHQMRGRSLRLDPALPDKVADNWDLVCLSPGHPKGSADYNRFVRKHRHYYAPTADGEIESGVSHVDSLLSPYGPPLADDLPAINARMLERVIARDRAHHLWGIGQPYENSQTHTVRVRAGRTLGLPGGRLRRAKSIAGGRLSPTAAVVVLALVVFMSGLLAGINLGLLWATIAGAVALALGGAYLLGSFRASLLRFGPSDALEDMAAAVADGLRDAGGIAPELGSHSVRLVVQPDGFYRCYLTGATLAESRLFAESLEAVVSPLTTPRYIVPRYVADDPQSVRQNSLLMARLVLRRGPGVNVVYHAVPPFLAANQKRAKSFLAAWNRHVSPGKLLYYQHPRAQAIIELQQDANPFDVTTQMRTLWR